MSRVRPSPKARTSAMELVSYMGYALALVSIIAVVAFCVFEAVQRGRNAENMATHHRSKGDDPCCLPFKFQAVITSLVTFEAKGKKIMRVYRDWESRLQAMEQTTFDDNGLVHNASSKTIYDYKHNMAYRLKPREHRCISWELNSGMLEPCMPEDSQYLGQSYIGYHDNKREFRSYYFRRTDKNRNMEMTIAVTSDGCVPVMEHVKGKIGSGSTDSLVFFSNVTSLKDPSVFKVPDYCFDKPDK